MKKKLILGSIIAMTAIVFISSVLLISTDKKEITKIFHVRLADPKLYEDGVFSDTFFIKNGTYKFRFVSSGDSPKVLTVTLKGNSFLFSEDFKLNGILMEPGTYYTWKYIGQDKIEIQDEQNMQIIINPHGNILGPVSVFLEK
ncbi:MAG: hypothetical protein KGZ34_04800 [Nitrosarchaeum sp.]|nr:hypothetical protein [Nitrosarchaeum sp.]